MNLRTGIITIRHPMGGTSRFRTDKRFTIGQSVCLILDSVHQEITDIVSARVADRTVKHAEEGYPDGMPLPDTNPYEGEEDDFYGQHDSGYTPQKSPNCCHREYGENVEIRRDIFGNEVIDDDGSWSQN